MYILAKEFQKNIIECAKQESNQYTNDLAHDGEVEELDSYNIVSHANLLVLLGQRNQVGVEHVKITS